MRHILLGVGALACAGVAIAQAPPPATTPQPPAATSPPAAPTVPTTGIPNPRTANDPVPPAMPADPTYRGSPYKGALTPPPPEAFNKTYPVCGGAIQDSCINPSAARED